MLTALRLLPAMPFSSCDVRAHWASVRDGIVVLSCVTLIALIAPALARPLSAQSARSLAPSRTVPFRCLDTAATVAPARLDAKHLIYTEQETVVTQRGRTLVAGNPVWVWRDNGQGYDMLAKDSLFGMVVDTTALVHAIPSPLPGRILDGMRAVALPDGWWMVSFAEVIPADPPKRPTVLAMWIGETDGERWRSVHALPHVVDSLDVTMSALGRHDGRARLLVPFKSDHRKKLVVYSLDHGRWTASTTDFESLAMFALRLTPDRDVLAVVRSVLDTIPDVNSLFLYSKRPTDSLWTKRQLILRAGREPVFDPLFIGADTHLLSWRQSRNSKREWDAWFARYDERTDSVVAPTRLTSDAIEVAAVADEGHAAWAVSNREWPNPIVQLLETDAAGNVARLNRDTRYRGLFGLIITRHRLLLIAAQSAASSREPAVVSMIETHTWRCRQR